MPTGSVTLYDIQKSVLACFTFVLMTLLALSCYNDTAHAQAVTPPIFFTTQQYQTSQSRNQLEPGSLASCRVPNVTITHSPGYVVPTTAPQTIFANLSVTPHAACNDGSPAVFLYRHGYGAAASRWVIYLAEGGQCSSQAECAQRQLSQPVTDLSSTPYATGTKSPYPFAGLMSPNPAQNPDFYDANLVQVSYCSSDEWMGEKDGNKAMTSSQILASDNADNWYFDGHAIVQAVIQILQKSYGLSNASEVLLTGGSAGAYGVFMNANYVSGLLPLQTRFAALADSAYSPSNFPDYNPATGGQAPLPDVLVTNMEQGQSYWNAIGDFDCAWASNQAGKGFNNLACNYPDMLSQNGTYRIPLFIRSSYQDHYIIGQYGITTPITAEEKPYVANFANAMAQSLNSTNTWLSVFGLDTTTHTMIKSLDLTNTTYTFPKATPSTLAAAIGAWYRNPCAAPRWMQAPPS
jgi:hypothetical protein